MNYFLFQDYSSNSSIELSKMITCTALRKVYQIQQCTAEKKIPLKSIINSLKYRNFRENRHLHNLTSQKSYCDVTLNELYTKGRLVPKNRRYMNCYKFYHKLLGFTDFCAPFVVSSILEAAKRLSVHKTRKKKPVTVGDLDYCNKNGLSLKNDNVCIWFWQLYALFSNQ